MSRFRRNGTRSSVARDRNPNRSCEVWLRSHLKEPENDEDIRVRNDGGTRSPEPKPSCCSERVEIFDEVSGEFRRLVKEMTWEQAMSPWTMKFRGQVVFRAPRAQLLRSAMMTHLAHHRAQLGVYLRLLDIPVPGSYGPTADEGPPPR